MADALADLRTYILGQSSVTTLIAQRMYLSRRPQDHSLPCATIRRSSEDHTHLVGSRAGIVKTRFQIEAFSTRHSGTTGASEIAEAIYKCGIDTLRGVNGLGGTVVFRGISVEDGRREYEVNDPGGGDAHTYVSQFELMVSYLE